MVKKQKNAHYYQAVGRRKESVARVRLHIPDKDKNVIIKGVKYKQGQIILNGKPIETYLTSLSEKVRYLQPLRLVQAEDRFVVTIIAKGGGKRGQLDAIVLGLSRALEQTDKETIRPILKKAGMFTRDARIRERRKVGRGGKARRTKQSPKR